VVESAMVLQLRPPWTEVKTPRRWASIERTHTTGGIVSMSTAILISNGVVGLTGYSVAVKSGALAAAGDAPPKQGVHGARGAGRYRCEALVGMGQ